MKILIIGRSLLLIKTIHKLFYLGTKAMAKASNSLKYNKKLKKNVSDVYERHARNPTFEV